MKKMGKTFCFSFVDREKGEEERKSFDIRCEDESTTLLQILASDAFVDNLEDEEIILIKECTSYDIPKEDWTCFSRLDLQKGLTMETTVDLNFEAIERWEVSYRENPSSDLLTILN